MAEDHARQLMQKGEECYPWSFDHFEEALANASFGDRKVVFVTVLSAVELKLDNDYSNHMALEAISQLVDNYWGKMAAREAGVDK